MSAASTISLWIDARGQSAARIDEVLRSAQRQSVCPVEIVILVDRTLDEFDEVAAASPIPTRIVVLPDGDDSTALSDLLAATISAWIVWLDAASVLLPTAIATIQVAIGRFDIDLLYGDSVGPDGVEIRRPAFSPVRLRSQDYPGDLRGFDVDRLRAAGGFRSGLRGAHPYDIALRLGTDAARVLAIPEVLSRSSTTSRPRTEAHRRAAGDRLSSLGIDADLSDPNRIRYPLSDTPLVSIVIPTRGSSAIIRGSERQLVADAVRGILGLSTYPSLEVVVVADDETPQAVINELIESAGDRLRLVRWSGEFNFSGKMNCGAQHARGEYLVLLNDDVELITADWIETMLGLAVQPDVGLVGTMLYFEDGTIQHGGHLYTASWAGHIAFEWEPDRDDALGSLGVDREVSGVTAACAMISAEAFWEVGGLSTDYAGNYNDVDFAFKVRSTGRSILWTPHARLFHFESKTRVATVIPAELATLRRHWGTRMLADPYWR